MTDRFQVGVIAGTHGLNGEVRVFPTTDDPKRFLDLKTVYLTGGKEGARKLTVRSVRFSGKFVILGFAEFERVEDVERLHGMALEIDRADALPLSQNEFYIPDLIGLKVFDEKEAEIGTVTDVLQTGANDVYVCTTPEGRELMLPAIEDCIREISPEKGFMKVFLMPGLLDL
ncbi:MAG: ribosome maturation factor RimM [Lachnospiraceae bacterium]|jgi:16S rRNA processing protein RimM|nr:ribosome maturation factor RimM [Lachnospiraceae bacterium]